MSTHWLGIEIGGSKLQVVSGDTLSEISARHRFTVDPKEGGGAIRHQLTETLPQLLNAGPPKGIGVGFGGPVDWRTGVIARSHQVPGWEDFPLADWLRELTGCRGSIRVENDANTAALAEAVKGAGQGRRVVFYVTLGSGVGGGLVIDGRIYHGRDPGEAELGHVRLDRHGTTVESRCSGWAVDQRIRDLVTRHPESPLAKLTAEEQGGEARHLRAAIAAGDSPAARLLNDVAADLAFGLSHVTHLIHPEVIILGGGLSLVGEPLRQAVADALSPLVMSAFRPGPDIRLAALREDAVPVGALLLAAAPEEPTDP